MSLFERLYDPIHDAYLGQIRRGVWIRWPAVYGLLAEDCPRDLIEVVECPYR